MGLAEETVEKLLLILAHLRAKDLLLAGKKHPSMPDLVKLEAQELMRIAAQFPSLLPNVGPNANLAIASKTKKFDALVL